MVVYSYGSRGPQTQNVSQNSWQVCQTAAACNLSGTVSVSTRGDLVIEKGELDAAKLTMSDVLSESVLMLRIDCLVSPKYEVFVPLYATITNDGDEYKALLPELELYAFAENPEDAFLELLQEVEDLCDEMLALTDDRLGRDPKKWREFLSDHISLND